ncbi:MAG: YbhB/YbcL family Raf kinase inhibitor-like protein [Bacteroidia bacterium]
MKTLIFILMAIVANKTLTVKSPAFANNDPIPSKYTCDGSNINPEINIKDIPGEAKSLALIVDDPDAPKGTFDHWVMWNIPVKDKIEENSSPGAQGKNGKNENNYTGPCPPSGMHHYHFRVYALDIKLDLPVSTDKKTLLKVMDGHIVATGELVGTYKK